MQIWGTSVVQASCERLLFFIRSNVSFLAVLTKTLKLILFPKIWMKTLLYNKKYKLQITLTRISETTSSSPKNMLATYARYKKRKCSQM